MPPSTPLTPASTVDQLALELPPRQAVWWACQSCRLVAAKLPAKELAAVQAAEAWVKTPDAATARAAKVAMDQAGMLGPGGWAAQAAVQAQEPPPTYPAEVPADAIKPPVPGTVAGGVKLAATLSGFPAWPAMPSLGVIVQVCLGLAPAIPGMPAIPGLPTPPKLPTLPAVPALPGVTLGTLADPTAAAKAAAAALAQQLRTVADRLRASVPVVPGVGGRLPHLPAVPGLSLGALQAKLPAVPGLPALASLGTLPGLVVALGLPALPGMPGGPALPTPPPIPVLSSPELAKLVALYGPFIALGKEIAAGRNTWT